MISTPFICATIFLAASVTGAPLPLTKRIAQVIADSTTKWETACNAAGGAAQCNTVAVASFGTLLAAAGPCDQQDAADNMVDLAKTLSSDADMITFAQIFAQQPRNSPNSLSTPYCQQAPKNAELNGLFQCQFQGSSATSFVGGLAPGQSGTVPFGMSATLSPAGSCLANPSGPIADGTQLTDLTSNSGVSASGNSVASGEASSSASAVASAAPSASVSAAGSGSGSSDGEPTASATVITGAASAATSAAVATSASGSASTSSFQLQNGLDAQKLNAQFATLTANSPCNVGDQACVNGGFAQCVGGAFVVTQCTASTQCAALPLVNKAGTSIACTTQADAEARIQATGATGGLTGSGSGSAPSSAASGAVALAASSTAAAAASTSVAAATSTAASGSTSGGSFHLQNGQDAQKLNAQFATLTATSSCTAGDQACVNGGFAQCVGGTFVVSQCAASTQCAALPLVNKAGTSITCTTEADAEARIQATGATGGLTGSG